MPDQRLCGAGNLEFLTIVDRVAALRRSPLAGRVTRYTAGSVVALAASEVAFAICYASGAGTTVSSVVAFFSGAVPNWILNRRWAWDRHGRPRFWREIAGYLVTSAVSLLASVAVTGWASRRVHALVHTPALRVVLVTAAYLATYGILFVAKFAIYELVIFADSGEGKGRRRRSRHQVRSTTRANRMP